MYLTSEEHAILAGKHGKATQKAMEILVALGTIYGAERMIPVTSVQIAGVSYDNLGEAGLHFLTEMAAGGGRTRVLTTLNPAGMDVENWKALDIDPAFAEQQKRVIEAFAHMGVVTTCTCTPYLSGNTPHYGEHIAWAESSAVCYANAVIGARTNREGGPSALAAALTGRTPAYGYHLEENRKPGIRIDVQAQVTGNDRLGALGKAIGTKLEGEAGRRKGEKPIAYVTGVVQASVESLKSFCASIATYGGAAMFHMQGITPEAAQWTPAQWAPPTDTLIITQADVDAAHRSMNDTISGEVDFVSLGCPHLSIREIARIAELLEGKQVTKEFWITTARPTKQMADMMGYTATIEASGAKFATDTCCVVAPVKGRFKALATDSAKACYYARAKNKFRTVLKPFDDVVAEALK
ncbi:MAG: aconitase X catalytic domain-containing protein [Chloroflexi bacterium]|nr:aconitase X catalytic domain-containing protein [Chloroflexota bacterium]